jgi:hypothetical protein
LILLRTRRTYHRLHDAESQGRPLNWFIYDAENERLNAAAEQSISERYIAIFQDALCAANIYYIHLGQFKQFHVGQPSCLTLKDPIRSDTRWRSCYNNANSARH